MKSSFRMIVVFALALGPLAASTGCVTKGRFEELESEKAALQANNASLEESLRAAEMKQKALNTDLGKTRRELEMKQTEVAKLTGTYDQLVSELRGEVASGQIKIQRVLDGIKLNVSDELLFPSGSASLNAAGSALLARVADQLKSEQSIISVEGHTDNVRLSKTLQKRYPTNWELAGARAASVVRLLSEKGIDPVRLRAVARGPFAPVASNDTAAGRAKNRRTEILLRPVPK